MDETVYNDDELTAPSWMNDVFFEEVLRKCDNDDSILITEVNITPATFKGDHYASIMFRAKIGYDTSESEGNWKSLIVKAMPEVESSKKDVLEETFIFETEIGMYSDTIPKIEAELRKIGDTTVLGVKTVFHSLAPRKFIIFEDIVPLGYSTLRGRLLNLAEAKAAFLKLAKWHAVSYKLAAEGDKSVTSYKESSMNMKGTKTMAYMNEGLKTFIKQIETIDELKELRPFIPKLRSLENDLFEKTLDSFNSYSDQAEKGIFVLCHGDFHVKNMMLKMTDAGDLDDIMLLDFQMCFFGPAVIDVIYALYMLVNQDVRENNREELIYYYCFNFIETLKKLGFQGDIPKVSDFMIEFIKHRHWELFLLFTFLPMWYVILGETDVDLDVLINSEELRKGTYTKPYYIKEVLRVIPKIIQQGYFD